MQGEVVTIKLPNGATALARVTDVEPAGAMKTANLRDEFDLNEVGRTLEGLVQAVKSSLVEVKPDKVSVELGLKLMVKSGKLTGLLVEGQGEAALVVTLEWEGASAGE